MREDRKKTLKKKRNKWKETREKRTEGGCWNICSLECVCSIKSWMHKRFLTFNFLPYLFLWLERLILNTYASWLVRKVNQLVRSQICFWHVSSNRREVRVFVGRTFLLSVVPDLIDESVMKKKLWG